MDAFSRSLAAAALVDGQHFTLPGFGTIEGVYISARINHSARHVEAPRLEVKWHNDVDSNAQTFAEFLESTGATSLEAQDIEESWLDALSAGESIEIGDLGSLVNDRLSSKCSFEANEEALLGAYSDSHTVALEPISQRALPENPVAPIVEINTKSSGPASAKTKRSLVSRLVPYASAAAIVLLGVFAINLYTKDLDVNQSHGKAVTVSQDRLNRSPREAAATADLSIERIEQADPTEILAGEPEGFDNSREIEQDSRTSATNDSPVVYDSDPDVIYQEDQDQNEDEVSSFDPAALAGGLDDDHLFAISEIDVVIVIGSFTSSANAARLTEKVAEAGFIPYVDQPGAFTRVGVTFAVTSEAEVEDLKQQMRKQFNPSAWVLE